MEDAMKEKSKNMGFVISTVNPDLIKFIQLNLNSNNEYINTDSIWLCDRFADGWIDGLLMDDEN